MQLAVTFDDQSSPCPNCFASLPYAIAVSLSDIKPLSALLILQISLTATRRTAETPTSIYVTWTGRTICKQHALGLNLSFVCALGLHDGRSVSIQLSQRLKTHVKHATRVVGLHPVSYDQCSDEFPSTTSAV